jgi:hypothetical protein
MLLVVWTCLGSVWLESEVNGVVPSFILRMDGFILTLGWNGSILHLVGGTSKRWFIFRQPLLLVGPTSHLSARQNNSVAATHHRYRRPTSLPAPASKSKLRPPNQSCKMLNRSPEVAIACCYPLRARRDEMHLDAAAWCSPTCRLNNAWPTVSPLSSLAAAARCSPAATREVATRYWWPSAARSAAPRLVVVSSLATAARCCPAAARNAPCRRAPVAPEMLPCRAVTP